MRDILSKSTSYLNRISEVIRTDATYIAKDNFLATHTPFTKLEFVKSGIIDNRRKHMSEEDFLEKQVLEARNDHQFLIVQGHNGSGKSHFIRWIKERYESEVTEDEEAILFISRWQSTLRGALEQITDSDIFRGTETAEEIKKLIQANEHLSDSNLKRNIIHQFAIAVQDDEGTATIKMSSKDQRNLYAFLVDSEIQEFMFRENGPIERIKLKLAAEASNQKVDVVPRFIVDDFIISEEEFNKLTSASPSKRALRLLENIYLYDQHDELKELLSSYLNQFIDQVVQKCTNLRGSDLKDVFLRLREELKAQGKNLTLFIEDITSFTGIDRALVEVLVTEHQGSDGEDRFCRIFSIVGITNEYYKNSFPDNLKERVTGRVFIDEAAFTDQDKIAEMAARYLNAIYVGEVEIKQWAETSGLDEQLPIAAQFQDQTWANFELKDGRVLTLFPFNKSVLFKLFNSLEIKTPRMFLKNVLSYVLHIYFNQAPVNNFPPEISEFSKEFNIPSWKDPINSPQYLERKSPQHNGRLATFLRLWGDETIDTRMFQGQKTVGELPELAFKAFNLPFITGDVKEEVDEETGDKKTDGSGNEGRTNTTISTTNERDELPEKGRIANQPVKSIEQQEFEALQKELETWLNGGGPLSSYRVFRPEMHKAIVDFIDWEAEEVEVPLVQQFKDTMINFEAQTSRPKLKNFIEIPRNSETYYALLGISAYLKLGNKSWSFPNSNDYIIGLYNWLQKNQGDIIQFIKKPKEFTNEEEWTLRKWGILSKYYLQLLNGLIPEQATTKQIFDAIMDPKTPLFVEDQNRSKAWTMLQKKLRASERTISLFHDFFIIFDSCHQGEIMNSIKLSYIDATEIIKVINELQQQNWDLDYLPIPKIKEETADSVRLSNLQVLELIKAYLPAAYQEEKQALIQMVTSFKEYVGESAGTESLTSVFTEMKHMLLYLKQFNEIYSSQDFAQLENGSLDPNLLSELMRRISQLDTLSLYVAVNVLAKNPLMQLQPFVFTFAKMDQLLTRIGDRYKKKLSNAESILKEQKTEEIIAITKTELKDLKHAIGSINREEGVNVY